MKKIYLIQLGDKNVFKIGYAKNPKQRLKELQTSNHEKLSIVFEFQTVNFSKIESMLHNHFSMNRINGEWFQLDSIGNFLDICNLYEKNIEIMKNHFMF